MSLKIKSQKIGLQNEKYSQLVCLSEEITEKKPWRNEKRTNFYQE